MDAHARVRSAFTLIELLVVFALIGILISLLIPAVQKVREAAQRVRCANNLKQLGLALHQYENSHGRFPPAKVQGPFPEAGITAAVNHGWGVFLLPHLEQSRLAEQYRWDLCAYDPSNQPVASVPLKVMQCPSAEPNRVMTSKPYDYGGQGACTDYAPTAGVNPVLADMGLADAVGNYDGVLIANGTTRLAQITDGVSNTILLTEDAGRPRQWQAGVAGPDQVVAGCPWVGGGNAIIVNGSTANGESRPGPCSINCINDHEVYSFHPAGANAVFADGTVRFLQARIHVRILARLVTRAGGEVISECDF